MDQELRKQLEEQKKQLTLEIETIETQMENDGISYGEYSLNQEWLEKKNSLAEIEQKLTETERTAPSNNPKKAEIDKIKARLNELEDEMEENGIPQGEWQLNDEWVKLKNLLIKLEQEVEIGEKPENPNDNIDKQISKVKARLEALEKEFEENGIPYDEWQLNDEWVKLKNLLAKLEKEKEAKRGKKPEKLNDNIDEQISKVKARLQALEDEFEANGIPHGEWQLNDEWVKLRNYLMNLEKQKERDSKNPTEPTPSSSNPTQTPTEPTPSSGNPTQTPTEPTPTQPATAHSNPTQGPTSPVTAPGKTPKNPTKPSPHSNPQNLPIRSFWEIYNDTCTEHVGSIARFIRGVSKWRPGPEKHDTNIGKALSYCGRPFAFAIRWGLAKLPNKILRNR